MHSLFPLPDGSVVEPLDSGAVILRGRALRDDREILVDVAEVAAAAPFRHMETPGGHRMSVAMTTCGAFGWVTDRSGYRYSETDPQSGLPWPSMPASFRTLVREAAALAGYPGFDPDSCLINRYAPGAKMSLHRDADELEIAAPIVSVSLGLPVVFQFGGATRKETPRRVPLEHGDVVVWGGPSRLHYHGVLPLRPGNHRLTGECRINLTFRRAR
jgi:alkylated DNA repair protein (DNA oxidative demethylase)